MTAVIHHGPPGSYKSFAIVQQVVIPALVEGRTVVTNIRGLNNIDRICEVMNVEIPDNTQLISIEHDSDEGFERMARFFQWAPIGALIVMDEGQEVYSTRLKSLSSFDTPESCRDEINNEDKHLHPDLEVVRPYTVEKAFDKHRHMGWDIYISTPNISKIHKEVRSVAEYAKRHREMSGVLPWWKNRWREFKHDAEQSGKSVSHYIGTPVLHKADKRIFECYQSTAIGKVKGSNESKGVFNDPKLRIFVAIIVLALVSFIYNLVKVIGGFEEDQPLPTPEVIPPRNYVVSDDSNSFDREVISENSTYVEDKKIEFDLVEDRKIYYTGTFNVHFFNVVSSSDILVLTSKDFEAAGYQVQKLSNCLVYIYNSKTEHFAVCSPKSLREFISSPTQELAVATPLT
jgi:zona occludens toxin